MNRDTAHRLDRRRARGSFCVVAHEAEGGEVYAVVGPTGAALYTFADFHDATAEAAALNFTNPPDRGSSSRQVKD